MYKDIFVTGNSAWITFEYEDHIQYALKVLNYSEFYNSLLLLSRVCEDFHQLPKEANLYIQRLP